MRNGRIFTISSKVENFKFNRIFKFIRIIKHRLTDKFKIGIQLDKLFSSYSIVKKILNYPNKFYDFNR